MKVVVVGAGVVGLSTAHALQRRGADVVVADTGGTARPASWGNAGWIVPSLSAPLPDDGMVRYVLRSLGTPSSPVHLRPHLERGLLSWMTHFARSCNSAAQARGLAAMATLAAKSHDSFDQLAAAGVDFRMWQQGLLFVGLASDAAARQLTAMRPLEQYGCRLPDRVSDGDGLLELEPSLGPAIAGGVLVGEERHVEPGSLIAGLRAALLRDGGTVRDDCRVTGLVAGGAGVTTSAGQIAADAVVIAAGAWSSRLLPHLRLPLTAGKGYSFSADLTTPPTRPLYLIEAKTGVTPMGGDVRFAGTMELAGLSCRVSDSRVSSMRAAAAPFVPELRRTAIRDAWAGLRPMAPDGLPYLGLVPGTTNVHLATGHGMLGITLGPVTGELIARSVLGEPVADQLAPFQPGRFDRRRRHAAPTPLPVPATAVTTKG